MKKFELEIIRTDTYIIQVDESIWTKEFIKEWSSVFYEAETTEDIVNHLAEMTMRLGAHSYIEGFGHVQTLNSKGEESRRVGLNEEVYCKGISIQIISSDDNYESEIKEL